MRPSPLRIVSLPLAFVAAYLFGRSHGMRAAARIMGHKL